MGTCCGTASQWKTTWKKVNIYNDAELGGWASSLFIDTVKTTVYHLLNLVINEYRTDACDGCKSNHPSQRQVSVCESWRMTFTLNIITASGKDSSRLVLFLPFNISWSPATSKQTMSKSPPRQRHCCMSWNQNKIQNSIKRKLRSVCVLFSSSYYYYYDDDDYASFSCTEVSMTPRCCSGLCAWPSNATFSFLIPWQTHYNYNPLQEIKQSLWYNDLATWTKKTF